MGALRGGILMAPIPDSSNPGITDVSLLNQGLAALKQGQYPEAIRLLEGVVQTEPDSPNQVKAQMGLVSAYEKTGDSDQAIALCQALGQHTNPQVRDWAERNLANLTRRHTQTPVANADAGGDQTGFVPLEPGSVPNRQRPSTRSSPGTGNPPKSQLTGGTITPNSDRPSTSKLSDRAAVPLRSDIGDSAPGNPSPELLSDAEVTPQPDRPVWRQAGRAKNWAAMGKVNPWRLWVLQGVAVVGVYALIWGVLTLFMTTVNQVLFYTFDVIRPIQSFYGNPAPGILILFMGLLVGSSWVLDLWLKLFWGLQPLSLSKLGNYSSEATRLIPRLCRQNHIPVPQLAILPVPEPLIFTYGCLPRFARIVVSQGVLDRLEEDEIAALYAGEVAHLLYRDFIPLSLVSLVLLIPYTLYWQSAKLGDDWQSLQSRLNPSLKLVAGVGIAVAGFVSVLSYGWYWLLRLPALGLTRQRLYYSDRLTVEATGNPNGLTRALLKLAIGTAETIQTQQETSYLLESLELLTPVGYLPSIALGSLHPRVPVEQLLTWDVQNPYAHWLSTNRSQPPLGDRLHLLARYARQWRLDPEVDLIPLAESGKRRSSGLTGSQWRRLLLQGAPYFGALFGLGLAIAGWLLGWLGKKVGIPSLSWLWGDQIVLVSSILLGFSLGIILRFNRFFPDVQFSYASQGARDSLPGLVCRPDALPLDSQPVRLEGLLLGRQGMGNWLGQDLILETTTGMVRLHYTPMLGPLGAFLPVSVRPADLVRKPVTVTGWFRRGATPWIDVDMMRSSGNRVVNSGHQVWSTIGAILAALCAIALILRG